MWENRCKVAVSGVGYSKLTRSADVPLAARALDAVKAAVEIPGWICQTSMDWRHTRSYRRRGTPLSTASASCRSTA